MRGDSIRQAKFLPSRIILILFFLILSSCIPSPPGRSTADTANTAWKPADVRILDGLDATSPGTDIVAVYAREAAGEVQFRIDVLELAPIPDIDIMLAINHKPGGLPAPWFPAENDGDYDLVISVQSSGSIMILEAAGLEIGWQQKHGAHARVLRNSFYDYIEIVLNSESLDPASVDTSFSAVIIDPASGMPMDEAGPVSFTSFAPQRLPVLLAFTNTYPAFTPSQGLRRWDGAHTGPSGGRHGLSNLLRVASNHGVHLLLLDLLSPDALAAMDYQGDLEQVRKLNQQKLLSLSSPLPYTYDGMPDWIIEKYIEDSRQVAAAMSITTQGEAKKTGLRFYPTELSQLGLVDMGITSKTSDDIAEGEIPLSYLGISDFKFYSSEITASNQQLIIRLPQMDSDAEPNQVSPQGLSLTWKAILAQTAMSLSSNSSPDSAWRGSNFMLVLGGSLPQSTWGHPGSARAAIKYIQAHPWIETAGAYDIREGKVLVVVAASAAGNPAAMVVDEQVIEVEKLLRDVPDNVIGQAAWNTYRSLFAPVFPIHDQLADLRKHYLDEVKLLLKAAELVDKPDSELSCDEVSDGGQPYCFLANESMIALIARNSGSLRQLFTICQHPGSQTSIHQIIGSTAQLFTGLSDPLDWDLNDAENPDPAVIPGAFWQAGEQFTVKPTSNGNRNDSLQFISEDGSIEKKFQLLPDGIEIMVRQTNGPGISTIPLLLDPWSRYSPGGTINYQQVVDHGTNSFTWEKGDGLKVIVEANQLFTSTVFKDSLPYLSKPENPNFEYPPGHFIPYPLAVLEFAPSAELNVVVRRQCSQIPGQ